ncbi:diacylglycerol kinase [Miniphocaeibacter massiliensis]|uniref:diacylglycerol kinase n=1 Tax=Miniphocaeibacter massiliensis TaxID=2041841 RepID=UPI000C089FBA|nr:diacylglycerol kinase [Miniphocaeibacter massiliensis]
MNNNNNKEDKNRNLENNNKEFKNPNIIESFNHAIDGLIYSFKNENNFKRHILMALLVAIISLFFDINRSEMAILCVTITLVILAELLNTALENVVDLIYDKIDPRAKVAKDVGAGAVLVTALNSIFVGYFIFYDRIIPLTNIAIFRIQNSPIHLTFIALVVVILTTLIFKSIFYKGRGTHLQGGTVSGHSSLAFCLATIITFLTNNTLVTILSFILAFLVAESRIEGKIHSLSEVIFGGITGILIATIIFKLLVIGG